MNSIRHGFDRTVPESMTPTARRPVPLGTVRAAPGSVPRLNGLCELKPYVYQGTGEDTLTAFMDTEPEPLPAAAPEPRTVLAMCPACLGDCDWVPCMGGNCCCACRDERRPA